MANNHREQAEQSLHNAHSAQTILQDALASNDHDTARAVQQSQKLEILSALTHAVLALTDEATDPDNEETE
ncbi:hypothetical protein ACIP5Z_01560 [Rothia terrae]|uniref:hypothetical protein n=1 Tax=Rothia terrae TaxID=396015 RepID=UPI003828575A